MKPEQSLAVMKALADKSRLAIVKSLLDGPQYAEEIAERHALAPSTVSFHLRKLEQAGLVTTRKEQYYIVVEACPTVLDTTLRDLVTAMPMGKNIQDQRMKEYKDKVLKAFFKNGRLEKLPAQHKKRLIILKHFAQLFKAQRRYSEQEVSERIRPLFDDYCTLRRLLVEECLMHRDATAYWREQSAGDPATTPLTEENPQKEAKDMDKGRKAKLKREYKQNRPDMGVYQLRNKANGKIYVASATNLDAAHLSRLFQLRMGKAVFNRELQKDLDEFGAKNFEFSVLEVLNKPPDTNSERALARLEIQWLEKLRPFGERGYNSERAFQRRREQQG